MRRECRWGRVGATAAVAVVVAGVGSNGLRTYPAQSAERRLSPTGDERVRIILAEAQRYEGRIQTGRIELRTLTENNLASERWLRKRIKDPRTLQAELEMARRMPRRIVEEKTIQFDNSRRGLLTEWSRAQGQIAYVRALFNETAFSTFTQSREGPPETRQHVFVDKPKWPPYSPHDLWRSRAWSDRIAGVRAGQITPRWLGKDPKTGQAILRLDGGPHADLDVQLWVDRRRGDTTSRLQAFDKKTRQLEIDEEASYRRSQSDLWYPSELIATYYRYDARGSREFARRETSVVKNLTLNCAIPDATFAFNPPRGAFLQIDENH